jgi:hypothetical protein
MMAFLFAPSSCSFSKPLVNAVNKTSPFELTLMDCANFLNSFKASISCRISAISSAV